MSTDYGIITWFRFKENCYSSAQWRQELGYGKTEKQDKLKIVENQSLEAKSKAILAVSRIEEGMFGVSSSWGWGVV